MGIRAAITGVCDDLTSAVLRRMLSGAIWVWPASAKLAGGGRRAAREDYTVRSLDGSFG